METLNKPILAEDAACVTCYDRADYMIWGEKPMQTYCLPHLQEARPSGTCYVFRRNANASFFIDGEFKT